MFVLHCFLKRRSQQKITVYLPIQFLDFYISIFVAVARCFVNDLPLHSQKCICQCCKVTGMSVPHLMTLMRYSIISLSGRSGDIRVTMQIRYVLSVLGLKTFLIIDLACGPFLKFQRFILTAILYFPEIIAELNSK